MTAFWSEKPPDRGSADAQASCDFALTEAISMKSLSLAGRSSSGGRSSMRFALLTGGRDTGLNAIA
jgi:hypothetical protein